MQYWHSIGTWYLTQALVVLALVDPGVGDAAKSQMIASMLVAGRPHITMTSQWTWWRLRSPASRLFTQLFIRARIKENWPLCGEFTGDRWILRTNGQ